MSKQATCSIFVLKTKEMDKGTIKEALYQYLKKKGKAKNGERTREICQFYAVKEKRTLGTPNIDPNNSPPFSYLYFSFTPPLSFKKEQTSEFWSDFQLGEVFPQDEFFGKQGVVHGSSLNNNDSNKGKHADKKILDCREERQEGEEDEEMKTRNRRSFPSLKKWAFKYYAECSAEDVWKDLKKVLEEQEKQNENRDAVQGAIINTREKHVYIEFTTFIDRSLLQKVPSIVATSIDKWLTPKISIMTLSNGLMKEGGYEAWPISQHREEPTPTVVGDEEKGGQDTNPSLFSLLNDESSFQILLSLSTGKTIKDILYDSYEHNQPKLLQFLCGGLKNYFQRYERYAQTHLPQ